jgi:hypothetical protein
MPLPLVGAALLAGKGAIGKVAAGGAVKKIAAGGAAKKITGIFSGAKKKSTNMVDGIATKASDLQLKSSFTGSGSVAAQDDPVRRGIGQRISNLFRRRRTENPDPKKDDPTFEDIILPLPPPPPSPDPVPQQQSSSLSPAVIIALVAVVVLIMKK